MPVRRLNEPRILGAIVALAFVLRLAWIAYADFEPTLSDDAGRYDFLGRSLGEGGGYVNPNGNTTMFWPPGYPFMLTAVYRLWPETAFGDHEVTAALVLNAMFGAGTVALTYALARRGFSTRVALVAASLLALLPSMIFFTNVTLTETAFTFLLMLSLWVVVEAERRRSWTWFAVGALIAGYASLVRGLALLLPAVLAPFWWRARGNRRAAALRVAVATLAIGAVIAPWTARNFIESKAVVAISSNAGVDFYIGHSDGAEGRGRIVEELVLRYPALPPAEAEARVSRDGFREGIEWALRSPTREAELAARKTFYLWYRDDEGLRWNDGHGERAIMPATVRTAMIWLSNLYYWPLMLAAAAGMAVTLRDLYARGRDASARRRSLTEPSAPARFAREHDEPVAILLLTLITYWTLAHIVFFGDPRFHAPVMPAVCMFAAVPIVAGFDYAALRLRRTRTSPTDPAASAANAGTIAT